MGTKEELHILEQQIIKGLALAHKRMIEFKKQKNSPVVIAKDGEIIEPASCIRNLLRL